MIALQWQYSDVLYWKSTQLIIFLTYPIYAVSPCHTRYCFVNINYSFRNSVEEFIPANFFHHLTLPGVLRKAARGFLFLKSV